MPNICLDVDGVISDICAGLNNELENKRGIVNYDYSDWLITPFEDSLSDEIFGSGLFWKNLKPFYDAWYQVNNWWALGWDIHLVTARYSTVSKEALPIWLDDWRLQYSQIHFADMGNKIEIIKEINPVFVVEDNPHEIIKVSESGYKCYLRRAWYNSEYWEDLDSIGSLLDIEGAQP